MKDVEKALAAIDFSRLSKNRETLLEQIFERWDDCCLLTDDELEYVTAAGYLHDAIRKGKEHGI